MNSEEELTDYLNNVLPTWAGFGIGTIDLLSISLPQNNWKQVRIRLEEEGLVTRRVRGFVELTSKGRIVALTGVGGYKRFRQEEALKQTDQLQTNTVVRWTSKAYVTIYIFGGLIAAATLYYTFFAPKSQVPPENKVAPTDSTNRKIK